MTNKPETEKKSRQYHYGPLTLPLNLLELMAVLAIVGILAAWLLTFF
jgi:prepilin-type N-terminal cleavage/methylation domain-containing protein